MINRIIVLALLIISYSYGFSQKNVIGTVNDLDLVKVDGKLGVAYNGGSYAVEPDNYTKIEFDQNFDLYRCFKGKKFEVCFDNGDKIKSDYLFTDILSSDNNGIYKIKGDDGIGYIKNKEIMIPPIYDNITEEIETYFGSYINYILIKNGKKGLFINGELVLNAEYDEFIRNRNFNEFIIVKNKKKGLVYPRITKEGKIKVLLEAEYSSIEHIEGSAEEHVGLYMVKKDNLFGVYSIGKNKLCIPLKYNKLDWDKKTQIENYSSYIIPFKKNKDVGYLITTLIDSSSIETTDFIQIPNAEDYLVIKNSTGKYQLIYIGQTITIKPEAYDEVKIYKDYLAIKVDNKWGLFDVYMGINIKPTYVSYEKLIEFYENNY